jgi:hypothetical protein
MIITGDCREVMAGLEPESVDAIVCVEFGTIEAQMRVPGGACNTPGVAASDWSTSVRRYSIPSPNSVERNVTDLAAGTAAEHLVCADLLLAGYPAFVATQCCPYDIAFEIGNRLLRVQVKATRGPRAIPQRAGHFPAYIWYVRKSGKGGTRVYHEEAFDLLALVALDCRRIAYMAPSQSSMTIQIRTHEDSGPQGPNGGGRLGKTFGMFTLDSALSSLGVAA